MLSNRLLPLWLMVFLTFGGMIRAADWPQFRGPGGFGTSSETGLPVSWDDRENVVWKTAMPGYGSSSPIALGDRLYVTCYSGYGLEGSSGTIDDLTRHVLCIDQASGKIIWQADVPAKLPESGRVRDHGYAASTPATDGERLYVFFGRSGVLALDLQGNVLWQADVGDGIDGWGSGTSPVLHQDLVIVNASIESGSLVALDKKTGTEAWRADGMKRSWSTPHLVDLGAGRWELAVNVQGKVLAFDPETGQALWACDGIEDYVCPSVISADGVVYVLGGRRSRALAIRAGGKGDVTETHTLWEAKVGANVSSPVIHGDHLYWVSDRNRVAYCVDRNNGEILYSERFRGQPYASTVLADNKLYVVTRHDGTFVLPAKPEFEVLSHNEFDDDSTFDASPVIVNGQIFLRSNRFLYCLRQGG